MDDILDPIFQAQVDSGRIPGVAAVAYDASGKKLYYKGFGHTVIGDASSPKVTPDSPAMIWSCTKIVTAVAGLQLVEQGKLNMNDPAAKYVPDIKQVKLLRGFNQDGSPNLVEPEKEILVLHLFTHTSGMAYDFFDQDTLQYRIAKGQKPCSYVDISSMEEYTNPLIFNPGERWEYGCNLEWLGFIIEKISGLKLEDYIDKNIVKPLGLKVTGKDLTPEQQKEFFTVHVKDGAGKVVSTPMQMVKDPPVVPGGHYLYSTVDEYAQFLLALLNKGTNPISGGKILEPDTVQKYIFTDLLPEVGCSGKGVGICPSTMAPICNTGELLPGLNLGWSAGALINNEPNPNGRNKGSAMWAGLGNCYFWIDPTAKVTGFVLSEVLPFFDKDVLYLADALERAVYGKPQAKGIGEKGSNFSGGTHAEATDSGYNSAS